MKIVFFRENFLIFWKLTGKTWLCCISFESINSGFKKKEGSSKGKKPFFEANGESGNLLKICVFWMVLGKKNWWKNRFLVFCNLWYLVTIHAKDFSKGYYLTKTFLSKKQHNHIKLPLHISALNSRFFENIVIPSKLDANRIIKFWKKICNVF